MLLSDLRLQAGHERSIEFMYRHEIDATGRLVRDKQNGEVQFDRF
jgi:hypothetical protein